MSSESFRQMVREAKTLAAGAQLRMILIVMAAVVSSLTLHHGAMASTPTAIEQVSHHDRGADCGQDCSPPSYAMPACCGMGLCLWGLPLVSQSSLSAPLQAAKGSAIAGMASRWPPNRIDRPPKHLLSVAV
jgi:hypothetical protein